MSNEVANSAAGIARRAEAERSRKEFPRAEDETESFLNKLKDIATGEKLLLTSEVQHWLVDSELGNPERLKQIVSELSKLADRWDQDNRVLAGLAKLEPYLTSYNENLMALSLLNPRYADGRVPSQKDLRSLSEDTNSSLWRRLTNEQHQAALELNKSHHALETASCEQASIERAVAEERLIQLESVLKQLLPELSSVKFVLEDFPQHTMGQYDPLDHAMILGIKDLSRSPIDRYRVVDASIHELSHALVNQRIAKLAHKLTGASNLTKNAEGLTVEKFSPGSAEWIAQTSKLYKDLSSCLGSSNFEFVRATYDLGNLAPNYPIAEVLRSIKYRLRDKQADSTVQANATDLKKLEATPAYQSHEQLEKRWVLLTSVPIDTFVPVRNAAMC